MLIKDRIAVSGGWIERPDVTTFNHYRAPQIAPGDAGKAGPRLDHVRKIYPDDADHIIRWLVTGFLGEGRVISNQRRAAFVAAGQYSQRRRAVGIVCFGIVDAAARRNPQCRHA
jgi:hypothetical protein